MTDNIIKFPDRNAPDADQCLIMPDGSKWYKYCATYDFACEDGGGVSEALLSALMAKGADFPALYSPQQYEITFWAQSIDDAKARVIAMRKSMVLDGQIFSQAEVKQ
jgi:hypothetical protein